MDVAIGDGEKGQARQKSAAAATGAAAQAESDRWLARLKPYVTGPGDDASDDLKLVVRNIEHGLETFEESTSSMAELKVSEAGRRAVPPTP